MTEKEMIHAAIKDLVTRAIESFHVDRDVNRFRNNMNRIRETRKLAEDNL